MKSFKLKNCFIVFMKDPEYDDQPIIFTHCYWDHFKESETIRRDCYNCLMDFLCFSKKAPVSYVK